MDKIDEKIIKEIEEMNDEFKFKVLEFFIPILIVENDYVELYIKDEKECLKKIAEYLDENPERLDNVDYLVSHDFLSEKNKFIEYITKLDEVEFNLFPTMYQFYAVSIFENMINQILQEELEFKYSLEYKKANILLSKLNTEDKLDTLLEMMGKEKYISNKNWAIIKKNLSMRNYFIHYKPQIEKYSKTEITKESIIEFINAIYLCYVYLEENKSEELKLFNSKVKAVRSLMNERYDIRKEYNKLSEILKKNEKYSDNNNYQCIE